MKKTRTSLLQAPSLQPQLEFELIKLVLLRERYIQRLRDKLDGPGGKVDINLIGLLDVLRDSTIETIETIRKWERAQVDYPIVKPFLWNGVNYMDKLCEDLHFLVHYPFISEWLGFSPDCNPFLVPPEVFSESLIIGNDAFIVFGRRPTAAVKKKPKKNVPFVKSPYNTPIINDAEIIPSTGIMAKFDKMNRSKSVVANSNLSKTDRANDDAADPFVTFLSFDMVKFKLL